MNRRTNLFSALLFIAYVFAGYDPRAPATPLPRGAQAPLVETVDVDGNPYLISPPQEGRRMFLTFFSTDCAVSGVEMPALIEFAARHPEFDVVAVDYGKEDASHVKLYATVKGLLESNIKVALDPDGHVTAAYGVSMTPTSFVIEPNGKIRFARRGGGERVTAERFELWVNYVPRGPEWLDVLKGWMESVAPQWFQS